jgi:hypothetical protein
LIGKLKKFSAFEISRVIFLTVRFTVRDGRFECARRPVIVLFRFPVKQNDCHDFQFLLSDSASGRQICEYLSDLNSNSFFCRHSNKKQSNPVLQGKPFEFEKEKKIRGTRRAKKRPTLVRRSFFRAASKEFRPPLSPPLLLPHKQYRERGRLCVIPPTLPPSRCTLYQFYLYLLVVERRLDVAAVVVVVVSVQHSPTPCCALTQGQLFSK